MQSLNMPGTVQDIKDTARNKTKHYLLGTCHHKQVDKDWGGLQRKTASKMHPEEWRVLIAEQKKEPKAKGTRYNKKFNKTENLSREME